MQIEEVYFYSHKLFAIAENIANEQLEGYQLSINQCCMLLYIERKHPAGTSVTELHNELDISKASLSERLKKLRNAGYLEIAGCKSDERQKKIMISDSAKGRMRDISNVLSHINCQLEKRLAGEDKAILEGLEKELKNTTMEVE